MSTAATSDLCELYSRDETAWLEAMAELARRGETAALDLDNLAEYLTDMAQRDRREVKSRLVVLLAHLLKWEFQPEKRTRSWKSTVVAQRQELADFAAQGVLRTHAERVLPDAYGDAVERAAADTGLTPSTFPAECPYTFDSLLTIELPQD
jgi:hypothetical protein